MLKVLHFILMLLFVGYSNQIVAQFLTSSSDIFYKAKHIEVGQSIYGYFGSVSDAPSGYHPRHPDGYLNLGFVADPDEDGWEVGTPNYFGDYFIPGSPQEGWDISLAGNWATAWGANKSYKTLSGTDSITGKNINYSTSGKYIKGTWAGKFGEKLSIRQITTIDTSKSYFIIDVWIKNISGSTISSFYYDRTVDPDNEIVLTSDYRTNNVIKYVPNTSSATPDLRSLVEATGAKYPSKSYLGLGAIDCRAKPYFLYHHLDPYSDTTNIIDIYEGVSKNAYVKLGDSTYDDVGMGLIFKIENLKSGDSTKVSYAYILKREHLDSAFNMLKPYWNVNGTVAKSVDTIKTCIGDTLKIKLHNVEDYSLSSWTPTTGLKYTTGDTNVIAVSDGTTRTYKVIATGPNACIVDTFLLTIIPNKKDTVNISNNICSRDIPYKWNGKDITASGTYTYITPSKKTGCDSTTIMKLILNSNTLDTLKETICASKLPYKWYGEDITSAGTYYDTFVSKVSGCDSIKILVLKINPSLFDTTKITKCNYELPFKWNGTDYKAAGTYNYKTTSKLTGCDSTNTLILDIINIKSDTLKTTICKEAFLYKWNGNNYTSTGTYTFKTSSKVSSCDSTAVLVLTQYNVKSDSLKASICVGKLPYKWNGKDYTASGTYTYNTKSKIGSCDSNSVLILMVNNVIYDTLSTTVCESKLPYKWNGKDIKTEGTYKDTFISKVTGCDSIAILMFKINPTLSDTTKITKCNYELPFKWNGTDYKAAGTYTYKSVSKITGCDSNNTLILTVIYTKSDTVKTTICKESFPYTWNGTKYTSAGTYTYKTTSVVSGCDSNAVLILSQYNIKSDTAKVVICLDKAPYKWNGKDYTATGTYTFKTTTKSSACDSVSILVLTVNKTYNDTLNLTICAENTPYKWNGFELKSSGYNTYKTKTKVTGCDSVITLNLKVLDSIVVKLEEAICESKIPYKWNGMTIEKAGTYVYKTGSKIGSCDSFTYNTISVSPTIKTTIYDTICDNELPYKWNGITYTTVGSKSYNTTSLSTGCDSVTTMILTVNSTKKSDVYHTICYGSSYYFIDTKYDKSGTYKHTLKTSKGCDSVVSLHLTISALYYDTITVTKCQGETYTFYGKEYSTSGYYAHLDDDDDECDTMKVLNLKINPTSQSYQTITICNNQLPYSFHGIVIPKGVTSTMNYDTILYKNRFACDSFVILHLNIKDSSATSLDTTVCNGLEFNFFDKKISSAGKYEHRLINAVGCDSIIYLNVHYSPDPITNDTFITACDSFKFRDVVYKRSASHVDTFKNVQLCDSLYYTWHFTIHNTIYDTTEVKICQGQSYTYDGEVLVKEGWYKGVFQAHNGCDSINTLRLIIQPKPTIEYIIENPQDVYCLLDTVHIKVKGAEQYQIFGNNQIYTVIPPDRYSVLLTNYTNPYYFIGIDSIGCENKSDELVLYAEACCELLMPNAFSPNGDGMNDKFKPVSKGTPLEYRLEVYNRFGERIYISQKIQEGWDGTYKNTLVDAGVYFWVVRGICHDNSPIFMKGDVTLVR